MSITTRERAGRGAKATFKTSGIADSTFGHSEANIEHSLIGERIWLFLKEVGLDKGDLLDIAKGRHIPLLLEDKIFNKIVPHLDSYKLIRENGNLADELIGLGYSESELDEICIKERGIL